VQQDETGRVRTSLEPLVLLATLALIPVLVVESDATGRWHTVAVVANWLIWAVFALELVLVLVVATSRRAALRAHWLDAAVVVVTVPILGQVLSALRLVRLLRLARIGMVAARAVQLERRLTSGFALRLVALLTLVTVVVAGAAQATFDQDEFGSVWDGIWWAVVTVTTVGYGDLYPKDVEGRLIGIALMLVGIGFLSVLTASVASYFVSTDSREDDDEIVARLERIERELVALRAELTS
jgi:voltage-gated potassium channel